MTDERDNPFALKLVSVRLVSDGAILSHTQVTSPESAIQALGSVLKDMDRENICVINLKTNGVPINASIVSVGVLTHALVEPREMLKATILSNAASIILMHNHPSGNVEPSEEDIQMTRRMERVCQMMGIALLDHVIVGPKTGEEPVRYSSLRERGYMLDILESLKPQLGEKKKRRREDRER